MALRGPCRTSSVLRVFDIGPVAMMVTIGFARHNIRTAEIELLGAGLSFGP